jgi:hypothetical protein
MIPIGRVAFAAVSDGNRIWIDRAGIALAIIAVVNGLGTKLNAKFTSINGSLK